MSRSGCRSDSVDESVSPIGWRHALCCRANGRATTEEFDFLQRSVARPSRSRLSFSAYAVTVALHVILIVFIGVRHRAVPVGMGGTSPHGIAAFVDPGGGPTGTTGVSKSVAPSKPRPAPLKGTSTAPASSDEETAESGSPGAGAGAGSAAGSGPVRLGTGVQLLQRVKPVYPRSLELARVQGSVVLDAIIHPDGTIGDIKILSATSPLFAQAAVEAVKQWRYAPIPFEGLVTVRVNFTLER